MIKGSLVTLSYLGNKQQHRQMEQVSNMQRHSNSCGGEKKRRSVRRATKSFYILNEFLNSYKIHHNRPKIKFFVVIVICSYLFVLWLCFIL